MTFKYSQKTTDFGFEFYSVMGYILAIREDRSKPPSQVVTEIELAIDMFRVSEYSKKYFDTIKGDYNGHYNAINKRIVDICRSGGVHHYLATEQKTFFKQMASFHSDDYYKTRPRPKYIYDKDSYAERLESNGWKEFRDWIKKRDKNECICCGYTENLCVHHMSYQRLDTQLEHIDCVTLCDGCHSAFHENNPKTKGSVYPYNSDCPINEAIRDYKHKNKDLFCPYHLYKKMGNTIFNN